MILRCVTAAAAAAAAVVIGALGISFSVFCCVWFLLFAVYCSCRLAFYSFLMMNNLGISSKSKSVVDKSWCFFCSCSTSFSFFAIVSCRLLIRATKVVYWGLLPPQELNVVGRIQFMFTVNPRNRVSCLLVIENRIHLWERACTIINPVNNFGNQSSHYPSCCEACSLTVSLIFVLILSAWLLLCA